MHYLGISNPISIHIKNPLDKNSKNRLGFMERGVRSKYRTSTGRGGGGSMHFGCAKMEGRGSDCGKFVYNESIYIFRFSKLCNLSLELCKNVGRRRQICTVTSVANIFLSNFKVNF